MSGKVILIKVNLIKWSDLFHYVYSPSVIINTLVQFLLITSFITCSRLICISCCSQHKGKILLSMSYNHVFVFLILPWYSLALGCILCLFLLVFVCPCFLRVFSAYFFVCLYLYLRVFVYICMCVFVYVNFLYVFLLR